MTAEELRKRKAAWTADQPYPLWPFGTVDPRELAKWHKQNKPQHLDEPAPF